MKAGIKTAVDLAFYLRPQQSFQELLVALEQKSIKTVVRKNADGVIYGLTYVDFKRKCVFKVVNSVSNIVRKVLGKMQSVTEAPLSLVNSLKTDLTKSVRIQQDSHREQSLPEKIPNDLLERVPRDQPVPNELIKKGRGRNGNPTDF